MSLNVIPFVFVSVYQTLENIKKKILGIMGHIKTSSRSHWPSALVGQPVIELESILALGRRTIGGKK